MIVENEIIWSLPKFKESMEFHWCEIGSVKKNEEQDFEERFKMFCRKSDCRCFVEDVFTNALREFNGAKAHGIRICKEIIKEEMRTKFKHKQ
jgi:hypothetical protein